MVNYILKFNDSDRSQTHAQQGSKISGQVYWYRFAKQRLHWTLPNLSTPNWAGPPTSEQCERWSDLRSRVGRVSRP